MWSGHVGDCLLAGGVGLNINANNPVEIFECMESNEHFF